MNEEEILKKIAENEKLLKENIAIARANKEQIKKIHAYMRRTFLAKLIYWIFIILITLGVFYVAKPYAQKAVQTYKGFERQIDKTQNFLEKPQTSISEIKFMKALFELFSKNDKIVPVKN